LKAGLKIWHENILNERIIYNRRIKTLEESGGFELKINELCVNTIRILSAEAVQKANSGHPGMPMGAAAAAFELWSKHMKHSPSNPDWKDRDRFILSAGHGSMLLYSLLHLFKYDLSLDDLKNFRQWGSKTPGHPEYGHTVGVETTTGPLGQGFANAVGFAIAEEILAAKFNRPGLNIVDHYTYVLCGDGCMMEGITSEAASIAGTLKLGKLIVLYDSNNITIEGDTSIAFTENVEKRFESYGWHVITVKDGNDLNAVGRAIRAAKAMKDKPSLITIKTQIGYGVPAKQGKASAHGEPLGEQNIMEAKKFLGWEYDEPFTVPVEVRARMERITERLKEEEDEWNKKWEKYKELYPELAQEWEKWHGKDLSGEILGDEFWTYEEKSAATRQWSYEVLNRLAGVLPNLAGGSADLAPSTKTIMKDREYFSDKCRTGTNMHFGVREHAMGAIANGMSLHGGLRVFVSTFLVFSDYMKPAIRLSSLMKQPVIYVFTHDSIGVGEDGPTHEPIEHLASLRSIPGLTVIRPADAVETAASWYAALFENCGPTAIILTRQNVPPLKGTGKEALKGAYVVMESKKEEPDIILMASGSEVSLACRAAEELAKMDVDARVVSMPSWELFEKQDKSYREKVLPEKVRNRIAIEAASSFGWQRYTGLDGRVISIDHFGASAPGEILFEKFGFTVRNIVESSLSLLKENRQKKESGL